MNGYSEESWARAVANLLAGLCLMVMGFIAICAVGQ